MVTCEPEASVEMEVDEAVDVAPDAVTRNGTISNSSNHNIGRSEDDSAHLSTE